MFEKTAFSPSSTMVAIYPPPSFLDLAAKHASKECRDDGLHVTLFYVGDTDETQDEQMISALQRACKGLPPLDMYSNGIGAFYNDDKFVRLLLMNAVGMDILRVRVLKAFHSLGMLSKQKHGFCGHLTLEYHDEMGLPGAWEQAAMEDYPHFQVSELCLVRGNDLLARVPLG